MAGNTEERLYLESLKETDWAYVAGMLDADGSISITMTYNEDRKGRLYRVFDCKSEISNTAQSLITWLHETFGGKSYLSVKHISKKAKMNGQKSILPCYRWYADGQEFQKKFLLGILPYLVIKKEQALIALEYISLRGKMCPDKRQDLHLKISALNGKESVEANTSSTSVGDTEAKIESDLVGDYKSGPMVTSVVV